MKIGLFLPNWVGDLVMATPAVRAMRQHFGSGATLSGIVRPYGAEVLAGLPWLDECLRYDPRARDAKQTTWALVRELRRRRLDTAVLLTNSLRTALIAWLSGARRRVGYVRYGRGPLLTDRLYPPRDARGFQPISPVDYYLRLVAAVGCASESRQLQLATTAQDEEAADRVWRRPAISRAAQVVVFNAGGAYGAAKHWPAAHFADLARRLARRSESAVLVVCGPAEREMAREIEQRAACPQVTSLADEPLSLGLSKACIRRGHLLVTTDSGPRHFAAAFGVPCVTLFGPTDPRWSWNYHPGETVLQESLPCVPCGKRLCPLRHHACMRDLAPDRVEQVVVRELASISAGKAA